ncbi:MAG: orange carotenoid protein N-terminal domain-containing protein, partial [Elainellaceae cyanobacterium]
QVKQLEPQDQLQAMRDITLGKDTLLSREYGSLGAETKLAFWYQLARGMEDGSIIPVPDDYSTPNGATQLVGKLESLGFEAQITVLRKLADGMGANPASGSSI